MDLETLLNTSEVWQPVDEKLAHEPYSDLGNAERLRGRHGQDLLFVDNVGWHVWDKKRWQGEGGEQEALKLTHETARAIHGEARAKAAKIVRQIMGWKEGELPEYGWWRALNEALATIGLQKDRDSETKKITRHMAWAVTSGNSGRSKSMLEQALPYLRTPAYTMDSHPWLVNASNTAIDLAEPGPDGETLGAEKGFERERRITRMLAAEHDPDATAPTFQACLCQIMPDAAVRSFLQRWFGYCLTGDMSEQAFCLFHGKGSNGKSTLVETIRDVMGDYAMTVDITSFMHDDRKRGGDATPDLARLPGARLVTAAEPNAGDRLSEKIVKTITGGERLTVRHLFKDVFEMEPAFKLVISCNQRPSIRGQDKGIWRRVLLVPFTQTFDEGAIDRDMRRKLMDEAPGILNWMLDGYREWREVGLGVPDAVREATDEYRAETDPVGEFLKAWTVEAPDQNVQANILYSAFERWCRASGVDPMSRTAFGRRMSDRGYHKAKYGTLFYLNLALTEEAEPSDDSEPPPNEDIR